MGENGHFSRRLRPDWGNTASVATAGLGSKGLILGLTKMHSLQTARDLLRPNCWMGSIDLKGAKYLFPVHRLHRIYLWP